MNGHAVYVCGFQRGRRECKFLNRGRVDNTNWVLSRLFGRMLSFRRFWAWKARVLWLDSRDVAAVCNINNSGIVAAAGLYYGSSRKFRYFALMRGQANASHLWNCRAFIR